MVETPSHHWTRSAFTTIAVLVGFVPGVILTVKSDESPNGTEFGFAEPVPVGLVGGTTDGCAITDVSHPNNYLMEKPTRAVAIAHFERARCIEKDRTCADLKTGSGRRV